ncbi:hypothetical protein HGRIS_007380 [Hohenbuehelia grisea]|uniref:DUF6593 domain-containing protein n=1 Tax=Hohenbuehelia grisea TaxID=104357 RepID=A0ABR3J4Z5_9AGAR
MNSQITLVDGEAARDASSTLLYFTPDNMKNSIITLGAGDGKPLYVIESNTDVTRTTLRRGGDSTPFAIVQRREILADKLSLHGAEPFKVNKWFHYSGTFNVFPVSLEIEGSKFIWKSSMMGELSLYSVIAPNTPIAWYQCSQRRVVDGRPVITAAYLVLRPDAVSIQDMVVLSFILLEHRSRMNRKAEGLVAGRACAVDGVN